MFSALLAPAEITDELHVQREKGKLSVQCVQTLCGHQDW